MTAIAPDTIVTAMAELDAGLAVLTQRRQLLQQLLRQQKSRVINRQRVRAACTAVLPWFEAVQRRGRKPLFL
jgi:hypothetical protein